MQQDVALRPCQVVAEGPFQLRVVGAGLGSIFDDVVRAVGVAPGPRLLEDAVVPEVVARVLQAGDVRDAAARAGGEASLLNSLSPVVVGAGAGECRPYVFAGPLRACLLYTSPSPRDRG